MSKTALRRGSQEDGNTEYFTGCPIGGGFMWFGDRTKIPSNCMICEGTSLAVSQFTKLNEKLGTAWGGNTSAINIPDLRGRFPRGVDGGAGNDPDRGARSPIKTGGNAGDNVGSVQGDINKSHTHIQTSHVHGLGNDDGNQVFVSSGVQGAGGILSPNVQGTPTNYQYRYTAGAAGTNQNDGGNETRPKNANVYFVIRVS